MANPLRGNFGVVIAVVVLGAAAVALYLTAFRSDAQQQLVDLNRYRWYIDEDGKAFTQELRIGAPSVVTSPSGKRAFPAELCYWTRDGKPKERPTPVLLNTYVGKPEPTFCPDCDRLVVGQNPAPFGNADASPPPTRAEFESQRR